MSTTRTIPVTLVMGHNNVTHLEFEDGTRVAAPESIKSELLRQARRG